MNRGITTTVMDDELAEAVRAFVASAVGPSADLRVEAHDGDVILTGTIRSETARDAITALVTGCEGVRGVTCAIEVAALGSVKSA